MADDKKLQRKPAKEQPLPKDAACNLGSINISEFVKNPYTDKAEFDVEDFTHAVKVSVITLDEVLNEGMKLHPLESQRRMARDYRNVGLGVMGIADMFVKMGITYGSKESIELIDKIGYVMFRTAVFTSNELAKIYGTFPRYKDLVFDSEIMKKHFSEQELNELRKHGLRNNSLLSIAPTGSIGTMFGVSTGIEPFFMLSYTRKTESLHKDKEVSYKVRVKVLEEYLKAKGIKDDDNLPEYFIESAQVPWKNRIDVQAAFQEHIDTAISSTVNLKEETTVDEVAQLYLYAWEKGLKGITIFRENCNRTVILSKDGKDKTNTSPNNIETISSNIAHTVLDNTIKPVDLKYVKKTVNIGCGEIRMLISYDKESKRIYDYYTIRKGNGGGCTSNINSLAIIISKYLKIGGKLEEVLEVLNGSEPCNSFSIKRAQGHKLSPGKNCATAMVNMLLAFKKEMDDYYELIGTEEDEDNIILLNKETVRVKDYVPHEEPKTVTVVKKANTITCPNCGTELIPEGGCWRCPSCDFNKCGD